MKDQENRIHFFAQGQREEAFFSLHSDDCLKRKRRENAKWKEMYDVMPHVSKATMRTFRGKNTQTQISVDKYTNTGYTL